MILRLNVGCGIGISNGLGLVLGLMSVLDFLETSKWGFGGDQPPIIKTSLPT